MPLVDQFYKNKINYYINSHEQNCGHAATGYAKSSGKLGVVITTSGPGITNLITPMLDAKNDGVRNNGKYLGSFYNAFDWAVRGRYELYVFGILTVYQEASYGLLRFEGRFQCYVGDAKRASNGDTNSDETLDARRATDGCGCNSKEHEQYRYTY